LKNIEKKQEKNLGGRSRKKKTQHVNEYGGSASKKKIP